MIHFNTLGNGLKRGILRFSEKISKRFSKPVRRFIADMIYGIIASNNCKLSEISRALNEKIEIKKTAERLGRHLIHFADHETLMDNYLAAVRRSIGQDTMLLIDSSDVTKPCSPKMEAIGSVYDASDKTYGNGYWTMGAAALSSGNHQPIPVYEKLYPCKKQGGDGFVAETAAALQFLREHFDKSITRVLDRGFDSGDILSEFVKKEEKFIIRQNQNRVAVHHGNKTKIEDVAHRLECGYTLRFQSKTGNTSICKIGMTRVVLPNIRNLKVNLVVCKEFGEKPLLLYTNLDETLENIALRVVKAYLMRWRIEEMYAFKKQVLCFEDFRVRSLNAIQTLDLLLTIVVGYIGTLCAKVDEQPFVIALISASKRIQKPSVFLKNTKFFYYAILDGITRVIQHLNRGISHFFEPIPASPQICFKGF